MKKTKQTRINFALAALMVMALLLGSPSKAFGYADPGTGAFVYQAAYAAFIGGAFYFRKFIQKLRGKSGALNR